jgi:hypothetical protein
MADPEIFLDQVQVDGIIDEVRNTFKIKGLVREANDYARESLLKKISVQLRMFKIRKSKIPKIASRIIAQLTQIVHADGTVTDMRVKDGSFVGITAAEATAAPLTQMTMKTSGNAGSVATVGQANTAVKEILSASRNRKNLWSSVYFNPPSPYTTLNFDEVYAKGATISSTTMKLITVGYEILYYNTDNVYWWHNFPQEMIGHPLSDTPIKYGQIFLRVYINMEILYERGIRIETVAQILQEKGVRKTVIHSPFNVGIIDIVPDKETIIEKKNDLFKDFKIDSVEIDTDIVYLYIQVWLIGDLIGKTLIQGIPYILDLIPRTVKVLGASIFNEIETAPDRWLITLNSKTMYQYGIGRDRLVRIFKTYGFTVLKGKGSIIELDTSGYEIDKTPATTVLNFVLSQKDMAQKLDETSEIFRLTHLVYADTVGTNLRKLFERDDVDTTMTISNDFDELLDLYGVEACGSQMIRELGGIIKNASEINGRHLVLMGDRMTNIGDLTAINYNGFIKQQGGFLVRFSNERGWPTANASAAFGIVDQMYTPNLTNVTSVTTGKLIGQMYTKEKFGVKPSDVLQKLKSMKGKMMKLTPEAEELVGNMNYMSLNVGSDGRPLDLKGAVKYADVKMVSSYTGIPRQIIALRPIDIQRQAFYDMIWEKRDAEFVRLKM